MIGPTSSSDRPEYTVRLPPAGASGEAAADGAAALAGASVAAALVVDQLRADRALP
jgi:hypothetical protein